MAHDNFNSVFAQGALEAQAPVVKDSGEPATTPLGTYDDKDLLELFEQCKKESFSERWVFERQWLRNIYYMLGRQWIEYHSREGAWKDKRMAKWIPRPVTNKCKETVTAIRAIFTDIKLGVNVRPNGEDPKNVSAAATADGLHPLLHDLHRMNQVLYEGDWWLLVTGNVFYHTFQDYDPRYGIIQIGVEQCVACGANVTSDKLTGAQPACPECGESGPQNFQPVLGEDGQPLTENRPKGQAVTLPLSPLEVAFPNHYTTFDDLPYIIRLRWRSKRYYEGHPTLKQYVSRINFSKAPADRSLQIFKSLSTQNDLGIAPTYWAEGSSSGNFEEGCSEYELWYKPCDAYPDGLVLRVAGDSDPLVLHLEETENIPGPFPYKDVQENGLFPFTHAAYEHVGGRILGSGVLDPIIQKQDQLNQLDSMIQMIIQRMANPVWLEPKGAEIEKFTGEPGLVVKWNPLTAGGNAKPERIAGEGPHGSFFTIREMYLKDIEELTGTYDIIKGARPANVSAFSAMQLLDERAKGRFSGVFQARGEAYKDWFGFAIELERQFGPEERTRAILTPARKWTFKNFKTANLKGGISVVVEDGSTVPKTNLGVRAAVEHASQLGMLDMTNPDIQYEGLKLFGLTKMVPTLDIHVQAALQKQQAFEEWIVDPLQVKQAVLMGAVDQQNYQQELVINPQAEAPSPLDHTPLKWLPWYNPQIHYQEFMKWANSDVIRELIATRPEAEGLLRAHLMLIELAVQQATVGAGPLPTGPAGAGAAMANSNRESTQGNEPGGFAETAQNHGPV